MASKDDAATRANNDWEVVSLTASAYAASPGPNKPLDLKHDDALTTPPPPPDSAQTSHPLYMSRHFVFPPPTSVDELHTDTTTSDLLTEGPSKKLGFGFSLEQETGSALKKDGGDLTLKGLDLSDDDFAGLDFSDDKGGKTHDNNIYKTAMSSLDDERATSGYEQQSEPVQEPTEPASASSPSDDVSSDLNPTTKDDKNDDVPPCQAWWKRSAASLIAQAKETNTVWSIFIAAAVMGVVILGQHWQHERWQILQLKWESTIGNEKAGRFMGPISRLKQAFVGGGQRRDSFIRASSHNDS
ncbi:PREDICTED: ATG8-interacting protein 2-like [Camelina sativa]|uniref:ATG8-interacting protein 2-like n=1 Tax=Camelina sativa TaxID=90675 RepID=A0ABM0T1M5_CAMSA|nr:PREDICTED: ATG8-interacting protein 2-like [Camelina sativa]XP_010419573.1 PREDICTED: ATG8-interacting protein 2-like [Camelina sativa]XP_010419574.1 PREDICTED: ATG8-interacting protein 2-like [Camelina sativa]XP_010419575.1 PREDICTED: ATG8-interacting protein 2-like [Camelina sativa]